MNKQNLHALKTIMFFLVVTSASYSLKAQTFTNFATTSSYSISLVFDAAGNLYATNYSSPYVTKITPAGVSSSFGTTGAGSNGIAIDAVGNLYVCANNETTITKITPAGVSTTLGTTDMYPAGLALDAAGNIYVANGAHTVTKIAPDGTSIRLGNTAGQSSGIVLDVAGNVYVANYNTDNITKITSAGVASIFATTGSKPGGITMDRNGNIFVANYGSNSVTKITPAGVSSTYATTGIGPVGIIIDSAGNVFTANYTSNNITKITPAGVSSSFGSFNAPSAFAIDKLGYMYVSNSSANIISKSTAPIATVILPIHLISFIAQKQNSSGLLTWQTASEQKSSYFDIERSGDGNSYKTIGKVSAAGTSSALLSYNFTDASPITGTNYYRLKETDIDGNVSYSSIQVLNFGSNQQIVVYPNPAHSQATITGTEAGMFINVFDTKGQRISSMQAKGSNTVLPINNFAVGVYQVQVCNGNGNLISSSKFEKY